MGSKSFSPRLGIEVPAAVVADVEVESLSLERVTVLKVLEVDVRVERKRKSCVSSERSASRGLEVPGWVLELLMRWEAEGRGSSSSESAMVTDGYEGNRGGCGHVVHRL